jgi:hypothetical protein
MNLERHVETDTLEPLFAQAAADPDGTWIVLDIDETLLRCEAYEGSEAWYDERAQRHLQNGKTPEQAEWEANREWESLHQSLQPVLVEQKAPMWIRQWRQQGGPLLAVTTRDRGFADRTLEQLRAMGLDFGTVPGWPEPLDLGKSGSYTRGVLFVGPVGDKGASLERFFLQLSVLPKRVFFADDRAAQVRSVLKMLSARKIEGTCFLFLEKAKGGEPR